MLHGLAAKAEPGALSHDRTCVFVQKHTKSAYYMDLEPTDESRTRGGSRAVEPAFFGQKTHGICILRGLAAY